MAKSERRNLAVFGAISVALHAAFAVTLLLLPEPPPALPDRGGVVELVLVPVEAKAEEPRAVEKAPDPAEEPPPRRERSQRRRPAAERPAGPPPPEAPSPPKGDAPEPESRTDLLRAAGVLRSGVEVDEAERAAAERTRPDEPGSGRPPSSGSGEPDPNRPRTGANRLVFTPPPPEPGGDAARVERAIRRRLQPRPDGGFDFEDTKFRARISPDGQVTFEDRGLPEQWRGTAIVVDVTEEAMRAVGDDPARYEKRKFMLATKRLRAQMAAAVLQRRLQAALQELPSRLDAAWNDADRSAAERRELLFELWDEALEKSDDDLRLRVAKAVRRRIVAFIREHLPEGSPNAYSDTELEAMNRRRTSKARFQPYDR